MNRLSKTESVDAVFPKDLFSRLKKKGIHCYELQRCFKINSTNAFSEKVVPNGYKLQRYWTANNNFHCFVIIKRMHVFVFEDHMLDWHSCQICYPLEIKLLFLL